MAYSQENSLNKENTRLALLERMTFEIKDSLTCIIGFSNIIQKTCQNQKQLENIAKILNSSEELLTFTNNMQNISNLISGKYHTSINSFSIKKTIEDVINSFNDILQKKKVYLHLKLNDSKIQNDNKITSQIFFCLFNHIIKAAPGNGKLTINTDEIADRVLVQISTDFSYCNEANRYNDIKEILACEQDICSQVDLFMIKKLTTLLGGKISFSKEKNGYNIKLTLPKTNS